MKLLGDMEAMYNVMKPNGMHADKGKNTVTTADAELGKPIESQGPLTSSQVRKRAVEAEKQRPGTAAGVAEMNRVALNDHTGGLHWYFYHTRPTDEFSFPSDRLEILRFEREGAINQINNPDSKADVLITSSRPSAFGANDHSTFHNDILLKAPDNTATEIQMGGRLWRIAQAPIDRRIEGEQLTICAFEIMATYLGHCCNRYPRKGAEWYDDDSQKMIDLGEFYLAIARTMILNPDLFCNMTPLLSRALAVGSKPGMEISREMVAGEAPIVPIEDHIELDGEPGVLPEVHEPEERDDRSRAPSKRSTILCIVELGPREEEETVEREGPATAEDPTEKVDKCCRVADKNLGVNWLLFGQLNQYLVQGVFSFIYFASDRIDKMVHLDRLIQGQAIIYVQAALHVVVVIFMLRSA
ncbi:hypothetical protein ACHAP6_003802 [Verticillium nonalfalfae]